MEPFHKTHLKEYDLAFIRSFDSQSTAGRSFSWATGHNCRPYMISTCLIDKIQLILVLVIYAIFCICEARDIWTLFLDGQPKKWFRYCNLRPTHVVHFDMVGEVVFLSNFGSNSRFDHTRLILGEGSDETEQYVSLHATQDDKCGVQWRPTCTSKIGCVYECLCLHACKKKVAWLFYVKD